MNRPTFFPGIHATCEDCRHFSCTGYHSYYCDHKDRDAGPFDTICECYIDRRTGQGTTNLTNETIMRQIKVKFQENLSAYRGRDYYKCEETGRYYTKVDGDWHTCTNNYYLEPDCHVASDIEIIVEP